MRIGNIVRCVDPARMHHGLDYLSEDLTYRVLTTDGDACCVQIIGRPLGNHPRGDTWLYWSRDRFEVIQENGYVPGDIVRIAIPVAGCFLEGTVRTVEPGIDDLPLLRVVPTPESIAEVERRTSLPFERTVFLDENGCFLVYAEDVGLVLGGNLEFLVSSLLTVYGHIWLNGSLQSIAKASADKGVSAPRISRIETRGVNEKIAQWLADPNKEDRVTWGIELEFDSWGDFTEERDFDSEGAWEHASEYLSETDNHHEAIHLGSRLRGWSSGGAYAISSAYQNIEFESISEFLSLFGIEWGQVVDRLVEQYRDNEDSEFWGHGTHIDNVAVGRDGSVNGPECRTVGALSKRDLQTAIQGIFNAAGDAEVNTGCSAHIHVKVADIVHRMDTNSLLYQCLMFALTDSIEQWPDSQMDRIRCDDARQWFRPTTDAPNRKYSPLFCHPQGTMEFRLWGNARRTRETMQRVEFTLKAIIEGYRTFAECSELLVYDAHQFASSLDRAFDEGVPLRTLIPQFPVPVQEVIEEQAIRPVGILSGEDLVCQ